MDCGWPDESGRGDVAVRIKLAEGETPCETAVVIHRHCQSMIASSEAHGNNGFVGHHGIVAVGIVVNLAVVQPDANRPVNRQAVELG